MTQGRRVSPLADPAKRYRAEHGNVLALKHGAGSPTVVEANLPPVVAEMKAAMVESLPYLEGADLLLVERAARQLTRLRLLDEHLDRLGGAPLDTRGRPRKCMPLVLALERQFASTCAALGIGPASRASLMLDVSGVGVARAAQERLQARHSM